MTMLLASPSPWASSQIIQPESTRSEIIAPADQERDAEISELVTRLENSWIKNYEDFIGGLIIPINTPAAPLESYSRQSLEDLETGKSRTSTPVASSEKSKQLRQMRQTLNRYSRQTQRQTAMVYLRPGENYTSLILVPPDGKPFVAINRKATKLRLERITEKFLRTIKDPRSQRLHERLEYSQILYQWLIEPLEAELKTHNIESLIFCVGPGLRGIPFAAFHDGKQYLVERYDISLIPAFSLAQLKYTNLRDSTVLAAGSESFQKLSPLPSVPFELQSIEKLIPNSEILLNPDFTLENVSTKLQAKPFQILHLATHAEFQAGFAQDSFVQFWKERLYLNQIDRLGLNRSKLQLLILSACKTALGDSQAELGFSGLALYAGVPSAIGSLWSISDPGTLAFMSEFYRQLQIAPTRAAALRQTQIKMIHGTLEFRARDLYRSGMRTTVQLPPEFMAQLPQNLSSPYYWAPFMLVGNPW